MKKVLALILALLAAASLLAGCQKEDVYEPLTVSFAEQTEAYKTYGRIAHAEKGVELSWPASGVEFTLKCSGDIKLDYTSSVDGYLQICVDGVETHRPPFYAGSKSITLAEGLEQGEHTFRILQESDIPLSGGRIVLKGVEFVGVQNSLKPVAEKELFIEFVGDSLLGVAIFFVTLRKNTVLL
jgi:hypothetical protein